MDDESVLVESVVATVGTVVGPVGSGGRLEGGGVGGAVDGGGVENIVGVGVVRIKVENGSSVVEVVPESLEQVNGS